MSENDGWKPMSAEEIARHKATLSSGEFYVGASGRPATTAEAAKKSIEVANSLKPHDVTDYLRTILEEDGGTYSPLDFNEKYDLQRQIGLLAQMPKPMLPEAFKKLSSMLEKYSQRVKDPAKLDQVRHYLDNYGQDNPQKK